MNLFQCIHQNIVQYNKDPMMAMNIAQDMNNMYDYIFYIFNSAFLTLLNEANHSYIKPGFPNHYLDFGSGKVRQVVDDSK
jgi:hypothetical protein